ncbi:hypothetical protein VaNZ11_006411 [Volvox africanus]|uniref:Uncharacterized protein n=1 Tax=Volvox africanus TaxID=51714 RepID=A0ABQ5S0Z3_9CHLO|nr:hypothetical protein VaNZ11_006411 [Volvox africanus]
MDPLSVLRDFNTSNKLHLVQQIDGNVQFGDRYSFPAATPVYKAAFAQAASAYYSMQDVLFYLKNRNLKPQEYVMAANQSGVANINIVDRKKILDVLDGVNALDPSLVPSSAAAAAVAVAPREMTAGAEPQAKRQRLAEVDEASAMKGLVEQERQLRSRNTMLLAPNKDFRRVLEVLLDVRKMAAARKQEVAAAAAAAAAAAPGGGGKAGAAPPSSAASGRPQDARGGSGRFGRDDPHKAPAGGSGGSAHGKPAAAAPLPTTAGYVPVRKAGPSTAAGAPPPPPPPPPPPASSSGAKGAAAAGVKSHASGGSGGGGSSKAAAAAGSGHGSGAGGGVAGKSNDGAKRGGIPIIIVPSGLTSMINMYNAKVFLEEGRFVPAAKAQAASGGAPKPTSLTFRRTASRGSPGVEYTLTDRPPAPGSPDWDRVVAVVVQGAKWQFKEWPHKGAKDGDLMEAFAKVCGFYFHFADEKVGPPVSEWNVRAVPLHRENRHKDMTAMLELYRHLDIFLQAKRSTLAF